MTYVPKSRDSRKPTPSELALASIEHGLDPTKPDPDSYAIPLVATEPDLPSYEAVMLFFQTSTFFPCSTQLSSNEKRMSELIQRQMSV